MTFREASSDEQRPPDRIETATIINPATTALLQELSAIRMLLAEIRSNAERQEVPAPGMFRIPMQTHVRIRSESVLVFPAVAGTYSIQVGTDKRVTFKCAADGMLFMPLRVTFERGIRVAIVDSTGAEAAATDILDSFILGYPE